MITHGLTKHSLFKVWTSILGRCYTKTDHNYFRYGGRGILVCDEWKNDFQKFYDWCISNGWKPKMDIDREDNDSGYNPSNCRFVTRKQNCRNRRSNILITHEGETRCLTEWAEVKGFDPQLLFGRLRNGFTVERLFSPIDTSKWSHTKLKTENLPKPQ